MHDAVVRQGGVRLPTTARPRVPVVALGMSLGLFLAITWRPPKTWARRA